MHRTRKLESGEPGEVGRGFFFCGGCREGEKSGNVAIQIKLLIWNIPLNLYT